MPPPWWGREQRADERDSESRHHDFAWGPQAYGSRGPEGYGPHGPEFGRRGPEGYGPRDGWGKEGRPLPPWWGREQEQTSAIRSPAITTLRGVRGRPYTARADLSLACVVPKFSARGPGVRPTWT